METINQNIKRLFDASGMTQRDFAEMFGIRPKALWTYLAGKSQPNGTFLLRICDHYSIDINFLTKIRIRINAKGEIVNAPDYQARALQIRKDAERLIDEKEKADAEFSRRLRRLITDLERIPGRKKT